MAFALVIACLPNASPFCCGTRRPQITPIGRHDQKELAHIRLNEA